MFAKTIVCVGINTLSTNRDAMDPSASPVLLQARSVTPSTIGRAFICTMP